MQLAGKEAGANAIRHNARTWPQDAAFRLRKFGELPTRLLQGDGLS